MLQTFKEFSVKKRPLVKTQKKMHVKEIGLCHMALDLTHLGKTNLIISSAGETTKNTDQLTGKIMIIMVLYNF